MSADDTKLTGSLSDITVSTATSGRAGDQRQNQPESSKRDKNEKSGGDKKADVRIDASDAATPLTSSEIGESEHMTSLTSDMSDVQSKLPDKTPPLNRAQAVSTGEQEASAVLHPAADGGEAVKTRKTSRASPLTDDDNIFEVTRDVTLLENSPQHDGDARKHPKVTVSFIALLLYSQQIEGGMAV